MSNLQTAPTIAELIQLDPLTGNHLAGRPLEIRDAQVALELLWTEYKPAPKAETPTTIRTIEKSTPGERAVARDVIARLNAAADLGSLLESKGATLVRNGGDAGHYSGLSGEKHSHAIANLYLISPADDSAHMDGSRRRAWAPACRSPGRTQFAQGWAKGGPTMAKVFGIHELELRAGVTPEQFDQFVRDEVARAPAQPVWTIHVLKGDRGTRDGKFAVLIEIESVETRNRLFPDSGDEPSPEAQQYLASANTLMEKWSSLATAPGDPETVWTDYAVVVTT